jgi:hypothetical protein
MVQWRQYKTYESAENVNKCLYVFKSGHRYLYIGKAKQFGGKAGRYAYGYRYLVDALLESGTKLFIAKLTNRQWKSVRDYENTLLNSTRGQKAVNRQRVKNFNIINGLKGP